jgi:hypothetical protein
MKPWLILVYRLTTSGAFSLQVWSISLYLGKKSLLPILAVTSVAMTALLPVAVHNRNGRGFFWFTVPESASCTRLAADSEARRLPTWIEKDCVIVASPLYMPPAFVYKAT